MRVRIRDSNGTQGRAAAAIALVVRISAVGRVGGGRARRERRGLDDGGRRAVRERIGLGLRRWLWVRLAALSEHGLGHAAIERGVRERETGHTGLLREAGRERVLGVRCAHGVGERLTRGLGLGREGVVRGRRGRRGRERAGVGVEEVVRMDGGRVLARLNIEVRGRLGLIRVGILVIVI